MFVLAFTSVEHRQDDQHQVRSATGAKHAGKHQESRTSAGGGQGSAHGTNSWNRCEASRCLVGISATHSCLVFCSPHRWRQLLPEASGQRSAGGCDSLPRRELQTGSTRGGHDTHDILIHSQWCSLRVVLSLLVSAAWLWNEIQRVRC